MPLRSLPISFKKLLGIAIALIGLAVLATGLTVLALRSDAIRGAQRSTTNVATILADQTAHAIRTLDAKLTEIQDIVAATGAETAADLRRSLSNEDTFRELRKRLSNLPHADVALVVANDGGLVNSTRRWPLIDLDFTGRDYFGHFRTHDDPRLHIGLPVRARISGTWTIYYAKRINSPSGAFLGAVAIGIPISYFEHIYDSIAKLEGQSFLLLRRDGTVLLRFPEALGMAPGSRMPDNSLWYDAVAKGGGSYLAPAHLNGTPRLSSAQLVRDYPLVVTVGISEAEALATWRQRTTSIVIGTLFAVLCTGFLLRTLISQIGRLSRSEASLAKREVGLQEKSRELERANMQFDAAVNNMSQGLCMFGPDNRVVVCNQRYLDIYRLSPDIVKPGCSVEDLLACRIAAGTFADEPAAYMSNLNAHLSKPHGGYHTRQLPDGRTMAVSVRPIASGGWVATHEDITERQRAEARIAHMARHDALTDLANRVLFVERTEEALERLNREGDSFAIFVFDLDLFKAVNDSLGHPVGDELLRLVAQRLKACMRPGWTAGRVGGDEFAVIQAHQPDQRGAAVVLAETMLQQLCAPYEVDGHRIVIGISIGIAIAPTDGGNAADLLKNADLALYRAKSEGRKGYRFFEPEMDAEARLHRALELDLRNAVAREEFELHYQTLVDIASHTTCGAEALIRWRHPEHGLIPPDRFIPVAEEIGVIIPLGEWILHTACAEAVTWPAHVKLAVNLSPVQFRSSRLVEAVREALERSGLPPSRLELEITESVLLQKDAGNLATLHDLAALGVSISLDDFGTGYSSLSYLRTFPFEKIKIDRSFVAELGQRADCDAIVCAITSLARSLDVLTTAEGVETAEQYELLRAAGCGQAQGYLFSRPRPAAEIDFSAACQAQAVA